MKLVAGSIAVALALLAGCSSMPGAYGRDAADHASHHPQGAVAPAPPGFEPQMQAMQEMHRKMAAARTPEERAALMNDHMKTMQQGMAMMGRMRGGMMGDAMGLGAGKEPPGGGMPMDADTMKRRMDMMDMMMQMLLDRETTMPPGGR